MSQLYECKAAQAEPLKPKPEPITGSSASIPRRTNLGMSRPRPSSDSHSEEELLQQLPPKKKIGAKDKMKKAEDKDEEDGLRVPKIPSVGELIGDRFVRMWWLGWREFEFCCPV